MSPVAYPGPAARPRPITVARPDPDSTTRTVVGSLAVVAVIVGLTGCGAGDRAATFDFTARDSAGITIVENGATGAWAVGEAWRLSAEPGVDIGVLDGAPEYQLFRVAGAARLSDGRIVVANAGTHEVRFYDSLGRHLATSGGEGEGPGEFRGIRSLLATADDSVLIEDWRLSRLTLLDPTGRFVRTVQLESDGPRQPEVIGALADGRLLTRATVVIGADEVESGVQRRANVYLTYGLNGALRDTIGEFPGSEGYLHVMDGGRMIAFWPLPFARRSTTLAHDDHVYTGASDRYEIAVYTADGVLAGLIRKAHPPVPVTPEDVDRFRRQRLDRMSSDDMRRQFEQAFAEMPIHETMPAFDHIRVDAAGHLWVEEYRRPGDEQPRWSIFDPDGRLLGTVETPPGFEVFQIGADFVLGGSTDEFEVEHVRVYALEKPAGGVADGG